jgi:uncharacterized membrane protein
MGLELAIAVLHGSDAAESAFGTLRERFPDAPWTREIALIEHHRNDRIAVNGTIAGRFVSVNEEDHLSQTGAAAGAIGLGALGLLLGPPGAAAGFVAGGAIGSQRAGAREREPAPAEVMDDLRAAVGKGDSAILLVADPAHVDAMAQALPGGARLERRALTDEQEEALRAALAQAPPASAGPAEEGAAGAP